MTCSSLVNCPANSWATGSTTSVNSHLLRLRATAAPDNAVGYNNAVAGAASRDGVAVVDMAAAAVSYPGFVTDLGSLQQGPPLHDPVH